MQLTPLGHCRALRRSSTLDAQYGILPRQVSIRRSVASDHEHALAMHNEMGLHRMAGARIAIGTSHIVMNDTP